MGDSLTAWPSDSPWPRRLDWMDSRLVMVHNAGGPGDVTADMLGRFQRDVVAYKPTVVFILGGTNDLGTRVPISTTIANLKAMINLAKANGIGVFLVSVPPNSSTAEVPSIDALNAAIVRLANAYKIYVIDIHTPLSTSAGTLVKKYTSDGLHFSALGAETVATAVFNRVHKLGY
jgi:lysophospholipase L1-like esterase